MSKIAHSSNRSTILAAADVFRRRTRPAQDAIVVSRRVFRKTGG